MFPLFLRQLGAFLTKDVPNGCLRKQREHLEPSVKEDSFSKLPDELLCHIISFLPTTKDVVRTSILAKRWKCSWIFAQNLVFDSHLLAPSDDVPARKLRFCRIVYKVLQHCKYLKRMDLNLSNLDCNVDDISRWVSSSIARNLETLVLNMRGFQMFRVPQCLYNCETLVQLTLHGGSIMVRDVPKAPFFPILKKLEISSSHFENELCFQNFILGCSSLQYLSISGVPSFRRCNILSPTLKELHLWFNDSRSGSSLCKLVYINAPALEVLHISGQIRRDIVVEHLSSLVKATISIDYHKARDIKFIQGLSNVKYLSWGDPHIKRVQPLTLVPALPAEFHNLTELAIDQREMNLLKSLMNKSKNLEVISLFQPPFSSQPYDPKEEHQMSWIEPQRVPGCLLSRVRKIIISGYPGKAELDMIMYLLKNAKVLKMLELRPKEFNPDIESELYMLQKIGNLPRGSETCEIALVRPRPGIIR